MKGQGPASGQRSRQNINKAMIKVGNLSQGNKSRTQETSAGIGRSYAAFGSGLRGWVEALGDWVLGFGVGGFRGEKREREKFT